MKRILLVALVLGLEYIAQKLGPDLSFPPRRMKSGDRSSFLRASNKRNLTRIDRVMFENKPVATKYTEIMVLDNPTRPGDRRAVVWEEIGAPILEAEKTVLLFHPTSSSRLFFNHLHNPLKVPRFLVSLY
jgi:hypothetical protein